MDIRSSVLASEYLKCRAEVLARLRPNYAQRPDWPLGKNGFGLTGPTIRKMTLNIMLRVEDRLDADLMEVDLPTTYPPKKIIDGNLPAYDSDVIARIIKALEAAGYRIVES
jgi:hypothetical protein